MKLRISSHKLRIETGRYDNLPRGERLCNLCNCNRIEDETHFLLDCPSFSSIRDMFFSKVEPKIPFLRLQSQESLLSHLMNSTDYFINIQLISFISTLVRKHCHAGRSFFIDDSAISPSYCALFIGFK